jgi:hypothetical protein
MERITHFHLNCKFRSFYWKLSSKVKRTTFNSVFTASVLGFVSMEWDTFDSSLDALQFWFWVRIGGWKRLNGKWRQMEWRSERHLPPFSSISGRSRGRIDSEPRNFGSGVSRSIEWCAYWINRRMNEPNISNRTARLTLIVSFKTRPLLREFVAERFIGSTWTQKTFDRAHSHLSFSKRTNSIR